MAKKEKPTATGTVIEALPNTMFRVILDQESKEGSDTELESNKQNDSEEGTNTNEKIAYLSGKMTKYRIRVVVGDKVRVELNEYDDEGKVRIVERL